MVVAGRVPLSCRIRSNMSVLDLLHHFGTCPITPFVTCFLRNPIPRYFPVRWETRITLRGQCWSCGQLGMDPECQKAFLHRPIIRSLHGAHNLHAYKCSVGAIIQGGSELPLRHKPELLGSWAQRKCRFSSCSCRVECQCYGYVLLIRQSGHQQ